jgi:type II secretory pathway pseudopilin PulG
MRARRAFTLLEAAVAMVIVAVITIGAMGAYGADLRASDRARQLLPAASLARERMSVLDIAAPGSLRMLPDSLARGTFAPPFANYSWTATTREVMGDADLIEMAVHVTWAEGAYDLTQRRYRPVTMSLQPR